MSTVMLDPRIKGTILVERARVFAIAAHEAVGQRRKYTNEPYWYHVVEVQQFVQEIGASPEVQQAALLHDVREDTQVGLPVIKQVFGEHVAVMVDHLTDHFTPQLFPDMNRKSRKILEARRYGTVPPSVKTIKLADMLSNTPSIVQHDPEFARTYLPEKEYLLAFLVGGDQTLWERAERMLVDAKQVLARTV